MKRLLIAILCCFLFLGVANHYAVNSYYDQGQSQKKRPTPTATPTPGPVDPMSWGIPKLGTLVEDATGNFDLIEPAGVVQGDLMIACIAYRGNAAITLPSGWATVATAQNSGDTDATNGIASGVMGWIVRGASAPALTCTRTAGDVVLARVISYSGGKASPYDTGSANTLAVGSATVTTGTITTAEAGELIVAMTSAGDTYNASAFDAATDPTTVSGATDTTTAPAAGTWKERHDSSTGTGADTGLAIADAIRATAGATGTIQATIGGSARHVMIAGAFKVNVPPTIAPNNPADASSDSDTTPTLEFTGTDADADSVRYNVQIDTVNTFDSGGISVVGNYSESNQDGDLALGPTTTKVGQSFAGNGEALSTVKFYLKKLGSPTGNATVALYAHSGTFGSSSVASGSALVTSPTLLNVATLTTSYQLIEFNLEYTLSPTTNYVIAVQYSGGDASNRVEVGRDGSSPTHAGNLTFSNDGTNWNATGTWDLCFYIYGPPALLLNKLSGTDSGFLNTVSGGDTDPFNSGEKVSFTVPSAEIAEVQAWISAIAAANNVSKVYVSAPTQGNLLIAVGGTVAGGAASNGSITGWTLAASTNYGPADSVGIWYKIAGASESSTVTLTWTGSTTTNIAIVEISGASLLDKTAFTASTGAGVTSRSSGTTATTTAADEYVVAAVQQGNTVTAESWSNSFTAKVALSSLFFVSAKIVSSAAAQESTLSWTTARLAGGIIATFAPAVVGLAPGTYYWRVRAIDPTGTNTYSAWTTTRSFTITAGGVVVMGAQFMAGD